MLNKRRIYHHSLTIDDMIADLPSIITDIQGNDGVILSGMAIINKLSYKYGDYYFSIYSDKNYFEITNDDVLSEFQVQYETFVDSRMTAIRRMAQSLDAEYNPIENYDRTESTTTQRIGSEINRKSGTRTLNRNGKDADKRTIDLTSGTDYGGSETTTHSATKDIQTDKTSPEGDETFYSATQTSTDIGVRTDSVEFQNRKDVKTDSGTDTVEHEYNSNNVETFDNYSDTLAYDDRRDVTSGHVHGNVGVTTNQQMITSEIELRTGFNLLEWYCDSLCEELLTIYPTERIFPNRIRFEPV